MTDDSVKARQDTFLNAFPANTGKLALRVSDALSLIHVNFTEYRELFGSPQKVEILKWAAPDFFHRMQWTLFADVVLAIARLTDPPESCNQPNASIKRLIKELSASASSASIAKWNNLDAQLDDAKRCLKDVRHKLLAHDDLAIYVQGAAAPNASLADVAKVLDAMRRLVNAIEEDFLQTVVSYELTIEALGGAECLMRRLNLAKTADAENQDKRRSEFEARIPRK